MAARHTVQMVHPITGQFLEYKQPIQVAHILRQFPCHSVCSLEGGLPVRALVPHDQLLAGHLYLLRPSPELKRVVSEEGMNSFCSLIAALRTEAQASERDSHAPDLQSSAHSASNLREVGVPGSQKGATAMAGGSSASGEPSFTGVARLGSEPSRAARFSSAKKLLRRISWRIKQDEGASTRVLKSKGLKEIKRMVMAMRYFEMVGR